MKFIISLLLLGAISAEPTSSEAIENTQPLEVQVEQYTFILMERTPCFGRCPSYKITISNTGKVLYEGLDFVDRVGKYEAQLSPDEMKRLHSKIDEIGFFALLNKYDAQITDIPSCIIFVNDGEQKKKIYDRYGAPESLKAFEKLVDQLVLKKDLKKLNKSE